MKNETRVTKLAQSIGVSMSIAPVLDTLITQEKALDKQVGLLSNARTEFATYADKATGCKWVHFKFNKLPRNQDDGEKMQEAYTAMGSEFGLPASVVKDIDLARRALKDATGSDSAWQHVTSYGREYDGAKTPRHPARQAEAEKAKKAASKEAKKPAAVKATALQVISAQYKALGKSDSADNAELMRDIGELLTKYGVNLETL